MSRFFFASPLCRLPNQNSQKSALQSWYIVNRVASRYLRISTSFIAGSSLPPPSIKTNHIPRLFDGLLLWGHFSRKDSDKNSSSDRRALQSWATVFLLLYFSFQRYPPHQKSPSLSRVYGNLICEPSRLVTIFTCICLFKTTLPSSYEKSTLPSSYEKCTLQSWHTTTVVNWVWGGYNW